MSSARMTTMFGLDAPPALGAASAGRDSDVEARSSAE